MLKDNKFLQDLELSRIFFFLSFKQNKAKQNKTKTKFKKTQ